MKLKSRSRRGTCVRWAVVFLVVWLGGGPVHARSSEGSDPVDAFEIAWTPRAPMSVPRSEFGTAVLNGKVYAVGGFSGSTLALVEEYDPAHNTWTRKADLPTPRRLLVVAAANGKLYAIGGASFTDPNALTYSFATDEFDPVANTWTSRAPIPLDPPPNNVLGNLFIGGAEVGGRIYVVAYNAATAGTTATYEYDPVLNVWSTDREPVPFGFTRYSAVALNGKLYVLGTAPFFGAAPFAEYDPSLDFWITKTSPPTNRRFHSLAAGANRVYAIGGMGSSSALGTVEAFDPSTSAWELATPLLTPRQSAGAAVAGGLVHAIGGADSAGVPLSSLESGNPVGGGPSDLCVLTPGLSGTTLNLHFDVAAAEPVVWNLWLSYGTAVGRVWSVALPAHPGFPLDVPIPNFPAVGSIGFLTTFVTSAGIVCSDWKVVDTGTPTLAPTPDELRGLIKGAVSSRR